MSEDKYAYPDLRDLANLSAEPDPALRHSFVYTALMREREKAGELVAKARKLVAQLDDEEKHHGGLVRVETLRVKNELRLELSRWGVK